MIRLREIKISELKSSEVNGASCLLVKSMCGNPNLAAIFKSAQQPVLVKQRRMFEMVLRNEHNISFTAKIDNRIVGVMSYTTCRHCQMSALDLLRSMPRFIGMFGRHLVPVLRWRVNWSKHDYKPKHIHFGPIAVDPGYQGIGIGKAMLTNFCEYLDKTNQVGYLETDKEENVVLYRKFGFEVLETDDVLGVRNWFMARTSPAERIQ